MIKVITMSTAERKQETRDLWMQVKPRILNGENFNKVVCELTGCRGVNTHLGWYRDLTTLMQKEGYDYKDYIGRGRR